MISIPPLTNDEIAEIKRKIEDAGGSVIASIEATPGPLFSLAVAIRCFRRATHDSAILAAILSQLEECEIAIREAITETLDEIGITRLDQERFFVAMCGDLDQGFERATLTPWCAQPHKVNSPAELLELLPSVHVPLVLDGLSMLRLGAAVWEYPDGAIIADQDSAWKPFFRYVRHTLGASPEIFDGAVARGVSDETEDDAA